MDAVVAMVNYSYIKTRAVKTRLLKVIWKEAGARHKTLVLHTNIRSLSKGKILSRFCEPRNEPLQIVATEEPEISP
jgi:hypothetical protein